MLIPPTIAVIQDGVITYADVAWWAQEVATAMMSAMMTGLFFDLLLLMAGAV